MFLVENSLFNRVLKNDKLFGYFRGMLLLNSKRQPGTDDDLDSEQAILDSKLIVLLQAACRKDQIARAFDLARMLTLRKSLLIAIKVASKERRTFLAEKLGILLEKIVQEDEQSQLSYSFNSENDSSTNNTQEDATPIPAKPKEEEQPPSQTSTLTSKISSLKVSSSQSKSLASDDDNMDDDNIDDDYDWKGYKSPDEEEEEEEEEEDSNGKSGKPLDNEENEGESTDIPPSFSTSVLNSPKISPSQEKTKTGKPVFLGKPKAKDPDIEKENGKSTKKEKEKENVMRKDIDNTKGKHKEEGGVKEKGKAKSKEDSQAKAPPPKNPFVKTKPTNTVAKTGGIFESLKKVKDSEQLEEKKRKAEASKSDISPPPTKKVKTAKPAAFGRTKTAKPAKLGGTKSKE